MTVHVIPQGFRWSIKHTGTCIHMRAWITNIFPLHMWHSHMSDDSLFSFWFASAEITSERLFLGMRDRKMLIQWLLTSGMFSTNLAKMLRAKLMFLHTFLGRQDGFALSCTDLAKQFAGMFILHVLLFDLDEIKNLCTEQATEIFGSGLLSRLIKSFSIFLSYSAMPSFVMLLKFRHFWKSCTTSLTSYRSLKFEIIVIWFNENFEFGAHFQSMVSILMILQTSNSCIS